ncbi:MAG: glycosyltransferase family 4 protein [Elainellaceae cyanobacterium]
MHLKRLLFITERFPPDLGGLARSAGRLVSTLNQLNVAVDIVTWSRYLQAGEITREQGEGGAIVHRIGLYRQWDMTLPHTLNVLDWLHQSHAYDAVWGHYLFPAGFVATWFAQLNGLASLISARGNDIDVALFPPGDFARLQWTIAHATLITAVSQDMARKVQILSQRDDVIVLKNVVNTHQFSPALDQKNQKSASSMLRSSLGIAENEIILGFSGELREKKGQQFLLNALTTVRSRHPACLLIIGEVRPSTQAILQNFAIAYPDDAQRVIITGHLAEPAAVANHLWLCDLYLQPSLWEGMPNALLEAMACGCCCIASDAGGIPEVIEHGKTGFLLPRAQLHRLGEAIMELLDLPVSERQAIGRAAQQYIQAEHSLGQEKQQLEEIIRSLKG